MPNSREALIAAIATGFPHERRAAVLAELDRYGVEPHERERERVQMAILSLAAGDEEKLKSLVQAAKTDYRDVLMWLETGPLTPEQGEEAQRQVRELIRRFEKQ